MADAPTPPPNLSDSQLAVWTSMTPAEQATLQTFQNFLLLMPTVADRTTTAASLTLASRTGVAAPPAQQSQTAQK